MEIILIAAMAANRVIGRNNSIPWHIPGEQIRFKEVTMGHPLIMGRKTWQSIGHPLPGRRNIVLTRNTAFKAAGGEVVHSMEQALTTCRGASKVFIIGGEQLYRLGSKAAETLILTMLNQEIAGDTFFPHYSSPPFTLVQTESINSPLPYTIKTYRRRAA